MFTIEMLPAEYGDSFWIEYGKNTREIHRILIDGGTLPCGDVLNKRIMALDKKERRFDLVVVTHIDSDHIDGMVRLMKDIPDGFEFDNFWFNAYEHTRPEGFLGAKQGEYLRVELLELEKRHNRKFWNESFERKAAMIPDTGNPIAVKLPGGMKVTVLGPNSEGLRNLHDEWTKVMEEAHLTPGNLAEARERLKDDRRFKPGWLGTIDLEKIGNTAFKQDKSASNGSSIILLAEYDSKRVLLTGDAFPSNIIKGLQKVPGFSGSRVAIDMLKIPHHGSKNNNNKDLFKAVDSDSYLVSTNGEKFNHPDDEGIARILVNKRSKATLYFNYKYDANKLWSDTDLQKKYNYESKYSTKGNLKIILS